MIKRKDAPFRCGQAGEGVGYVNNVVELLAAVQRYNYVAVQRFNGGVPEHRFSSGVGLRLGIQIYIMYLRQAVIYQVNLLPVPILGHGDGGRETEDLNTVGLPYVSGVLGFQYGVGCAVGVDAAIRDLGVDDVAAVAPEEQDIGHFGQETEDGRPAGFAGVDGEGRVVVDQGIAVAKRGELQSGPRHDEVEQLKDVHAA